MPGGILVTSPQAITALLVAWQAGVVTVHDFGVYDDDRAYLVMELLDGRSLREELRERGRLEPKRAMEILRGVAAATALPGERWRRAVSGLSMEGSPRAWERDRGGS